MSLKRTKTPIMGWAALLIFLYHLLPLPRTQDVYSTLIRYLVTTAYIGVDIFFFMSGYMATYSDTSNYWGYVKRKLFRIYPMFLAFGIVGILMGKLALTKAWQTFLGLDLFLSGGGAFLWFIPALLVFYLAVPLYLRLLNKVGNWKTFFLGLALWLGLMLILENTLSKHAANIFLCRIPVILLGISLAKYEGRWETKTKFLIGLLLLCFGVFLTWNFGFRSKIEFLISDTFYLIALPHILGTVLLADVLFSSFRSRIFDFIGRISLELYCVQMVFGPMFFQYIIYVTKNTLLSFVLTLFFVFLSSYTIRFMKEKLRFLSPYHGPKTSV